MSIAGTATVSGPVAELEHVDGLRVETLHDSQAGVLQAIRRLYLPDGPDADVTFSTGGLYRDGTMPLPRLRFDVAPELPGVVLADCRHLPLASGSLGSILFDPPFVVACGVNSRIGNRFSCLSTIPLLHAFYREAVREFARVLRPGGIFVVKIQDTVSGGKQHRSSIVIWQAAVAAGFLDEDQFVVRNVSHLRGHNWSCQQHARKTHLFWLVFRRRSTLSERRLA